MEGLVIRNLHVKYQSPTTNGSRDRQQSNTILGQGQRSWYQMKGLVIRNLHVKYQSPTPYGSRDMANFEFFEM